MTKNYHGYATLENANEVQNIANEEAFILCLMLQYPNENGAHATALAKTTKGTGGTRFFDPNWSEFNYVANGGTLGKDIMEFLAYLYGDALKRVVVFRMA